MLFGWSCLFLINFYKYVILKSSLLYALPWN